MHDLTNGRHALNLRTEPLIYNICRFYVTRGNPSHENDFYITVHIHLSYSFKNTLN